MFSPVRALTITTQNPHNHKVEAVAYIRVSTDDQTLGPQAQKSQIQAYAAQHDLEVTHWFEDLGYSGATALEDRPGLLAVTDHCAQHKGTKVLIAKRDRLARDIVIAAMVERLLEKSHSTIECADGTGNGITPEAMLIKGIVDVFAQYERALIRARTKAALRIKKQKGERVGNYAYGTQQGQAGKVVSHPQEQHTLGLIYLYHDEGRTPYWIANKLNQDQTPARGKQWYEKTVRRILAAPLHPNTT